MADEDLTGDVQSTPSPEPAPKLSRSEIVDRAVDRAMKGAEPPPEAELGKKPSKLDQTDTKPPSKPDERPDRARDEHGKFTKQPETSDTEPSTDVSPAPTQQAPAVAPATLQAPPRWSDADKAAFLSLPQEAQQAILRREQERDADYTRKTQEVAEQRKSVEPLLQALNPHADYLNQVGQQLGVNVPTMLTTLVQTERSLRTGSPEQRAMTLAQLIRDYPTDLQLLNRALGQAPARPVMAPDPLINNLRQEFDDLKRWREERDLHDAKQRVEAFATQKDEHGQPKYPHFDAVRAQMAQLVDRGMSYDDAYLVSAKPINDAIASREAQIKAAAEAAQKERAASVERAKQASSPRSSGTQPNGSVPLNRSQLVAQAMERAGIK